VKVYEVSGIRGGAVSYSCGHCDKKIRSGQWVLEWQKLDNEGLYTKLRVVTHVSCLRQLLMDVPLESEEAFLLLRDQMKVSGRVFPS
jgi:hypothetical protein